MKIELVNFGCWEKETFEFQDDGTNLISGRSGRGKTTVLRAVVFALFGIGRKVVREGCTSCRVTVQFKDLKIVRTKGPCRLVVNDVWEDAEAQAVLDERFGNASSCYLEQNGAKSFVNMTPQQKLEFLEEITYAQANVGQLKERLNNLVKTNERTQLSIESKVEILTGQLEQFRCPAKPELEFSEPEDVDEGVQEAMNELERMEHEYVDVKNKIQQQEKMRLLLERAETSLSLRLEERDKLVLEKKDVERQIDAIELDKREDWKQVEEQILLHQEWEAKKCELERLEQIHLHTIETERNQLETQIKQIQSTIENICDTYEIEGKGRTTAFKKLVEEEQERKEMIATLHELEQKLEQEQHLQTRLKQQEQELDELRIQAGNFYTCPSCSQNLALNHDALVCVQERTMDAKKAKKKLVKTEQAYNNTKDQLVLMKSWKEQYNQLLSRLSDKIGRPGIEQDYERFVSEKSSLKEVKRSLDKVEERFKGMGEQIQTLRTQVEDGTVEYDLEWSLDEVRERIEYNRQQRQERKSLKSRLERLNQTLHELDEQIQCLRQEREEYTVQHDDTLQSRLDTLYTMIANQRTTITLLQRLQEYYERVAERTQLEERVKTFQTEKQELLSKHRQYTALKKYIATAEQIALQQTIHSINVSVQHYLDGFFKEEPLVAQLYLIKNKGTKKEKQQLGIEVIYKGMSMEPSRLSGGEYDRLNLAFVLTLTEMNKSPILLLDECLRSLDQETAEQTCAYIKKPHPHSTVILVAHQIVTGFFDRVITF